jgi:hypothetical protein
MKFERVKGGIRLVDKCGNYIIPCRLCSNYTSGECVKAKQGRRIKSIVIKAVSSVNK